MTRNKINSLLRKITDVNDRFFLKNGFNFARLEYLQIEPTIRCNLNCIICDKEMKTRTDKRDINFEEFKIILDQFPLLRQLNFAGYGEPLLNVDIFKMVKHAKSKDVFTYFATNAMLLNSNMAEKIIDSGLDCLIFSVDSGVSSTYNKIRIGARLDVVRTNIKNFIELANNRKSPIQTKIYSVVIFNNINDLKELVNFTREVGVKNLVLRAIYDHTGRSQEYSRDALYHPDNVKIAKDCIKEARAHAKKMGINISAPPLEPDEHYRCRMPYIRPYITVEGFVTPCCLQGLDPRRINFGNVFEENYKKIHNNKKFRNFRKLLNSKNPPGICRSCPRYKGMA